MGNYWSKRLTKLFLIGAIAVSFPGNIIYQQIAKKTKPTETRAMHSLMTSISLETKVEYNDSSIKEIINSINKKLKPRLYSGLNAFKYREGSIFNYAPMVSKAGDRVLTEIVDKATYGANSYEEAVQRLLDVVTKNVRYDSIPEFTNPRKLNPYFVLRNKRSDCGGKTITFSAMLEQMGGADYYLAYFKDHIAVAVRGKFPKDNRSYFISDDKEYFFAETTVEGFVIGKTMLEDPNMFSELEALQRVGNNSKPYDMKLHKQLTLVHNDGD